MRIGSGRWRDGDEQDADRHRVDGVEAGGVGAVVAGAEGTASHGGSGPNDPAVGYREAALGGGPGGREAAADRPEMGGALRPQATAGTGRCAT